MTIQKLIQERRISMMVGYWLNAVALSEVFGWTPSELRDQEVFALECYQAVLRGKGGTSRSAKKALGGV